MVEKEKCLYCELLSENSVDMQFIFQNGSPIIIKNKEISFCPFCGRKLEEEKEGDYDKLAYLNDDIKGVAKGLKNSNRHIDFIDYFKQNPKGLMKFKEKFINSFNTNEWYSYEYINEGAYENFLKFGGFAIQLGKVLEVKFEVKK